MKVLFVINALGWGGAERSLAELLPHLQTEGIDSLVVCLKQAGGGVERGVVDAGADVRFLHGHNLVSRVWELQRLIRAERPDVIHTVLFDANLAGRLASIRSNAVVLTSLVSPLYDDARLANPQLHPIKLRVAKVVDGWTARHLSDHFHAITEAVAHSYVRQLRLPAGRITVITRGRDPDRLGQPGSARRRAARDKLGLADRTEVLVHVGRHEYPKGISCLVEALALLTDRPDLVLLQAGRRGNSSSEIDRIAAALGVSPRIRFLGYRDDVPDLLAAADVFVFPSLFEGLGGSVIEAMALALPVVAADIPAIREVVDPGKNALLVAPGDPVALADAIRCLLDDRVMAHQMGARSAELFASRFSLATVCAATVDLYRSLTARHSVGDAAKQSRGR